MGDIHPIYTRASRGQPPTGPSPSSPNPLGSAIGCLAAGAWSLWFVHWFAAVAWLSLTLTIIGYVAIFFGALLVGTSLGNLLDRRRRHGH